MEFKTFETAFSIDSNIIDSIGDDLPSHDHYVIKQCLQNISLEIFKENMATVKHIYRYRHLVTGQLLEVPSREDIENFQLIEKVIKISLFVGKRG